MTSPSLTRDAIVEVARTQIEKNGIESLSFRGVARELGVTAPALYAYVEDKQSLLEAIATEHFAELARRFEAIEPIDDPVERIRRLSRAYVDHALASPALFKVMFRFPPRAVPGADVFAPAAEVFEMAAVATHDAIAAGTFKSQDVDLVNLTMWASIHGVASVLLLGLSGDAAHADRLVDAVIDAMLAGQINPLT